MMKILMLTCTLMCIYSYAAFSASFNCNRASTCTENMICETLQLFSLDSRMDRLYKDKIIEQLFSILFRINLGISHTGSFIALNPMLSW
jgi:uncharacterized protein